MNARLPLALLLLVVAVTAAAAQSKNGKTEEMGTPEQRAACEPDVRRFCKSVKPEEGPFAYLNCLQENIDKLRPACVKVISGTPPPQ